MTLLDVLVLLMLKAGVRLPESYSEVLNKTINPHKATQMLQTEISYMLGVVAQTRNLSTLRS